MTDKKTKSATANVADLNKEELEAQKAELDKREAELNEREEKLNLKEAELTERESELPAPAKKPEKKVPGLEFEFRNTKYKFRDSAPKSIRFMGDVYTQKELADDEDALVELVASNSVLIEKL